MSEQFLPCPNCNGPIPLTAPPLPGQQVVCPACQRAVTPIAARSGSRRALFVGIALAACVVLATGAVIGLILWSNSRGTDAATPQQLGTTAEPFAPSNPDIAPTENASAEVASPSLPNFEYKWQPNETYLYEVRIIAEVPADGIDSSKRKTVLYGINEYTVRPEEQANRGGLAEFDQGVQLGSAFTVHADGYLLTNAHLVLGAERIEVELDGKRFEGKVAGMNRSSDLALLRIDAKGLPALPVDDSQQTELTEHVRIIGHAFDDRPVLKGGTISGIIPGYDNRYFQLDVPVDPAYDGGPVINDSGRAVGILTTSIPSVGLKEVTIAAELANVQELLAPHDLTAATDPAGDPSRAVAAIRVTRSPQGYGMAKRFALKCRSYIRWNEYLFRDDVDQQLAVDFFEPKEATLIVDQYGQLLHESASNELPFLLGSVWTLPLERLPSAEDSQSHWSQQELIPFVSSEGSEAFQVLDQPLLPAPFKAFFQLQGLLDAVQQGWQPEETTEIIPAVDYTFYESQPPRLGLTVVDKTRMVRTLGEEEDSPGFDSSESGQFVFDREAGLTEGIWLEVEYTLTGKAREHELHVTVGCRRIDSRDPAVAALAGGVNGVLNQFSACEKAYAHTVVATTLKDSPLLDIEPMFLLSDQVVSLARAFARVSHERDNAIRLFGKWGTEAQVPEIMRYAESSRHLEAVSQALALMKNEPALRELVELVREHGSEVTDRLNSPQYEEALLRLSDVRHLRISRPAHTTLAWVGDVKTVRFVQQNLGTYPQQSQVRQDATKLLNDLMDRASRNGDRRLLEQLTRSPYVPVPPQHDIDPIYDFIDKHAYNRPYACLQQLARLKSLTPDEENRAKVQARTFRYLTHGDERLQVAACQVLAVWANQLSAAQRLESRAADPSERGIVFRAAALKAAKIIRDRVSENDEEQL